MASYLVSLINHFRREVVFFSINLVLRSFSRQERLDRNGRRTCSRTVFTLAISIQPWVSASPFIFFCALNVQYQAKGHVLCSRYTLIQIFSKSGNLSRLDFLFHKSGLLCNKPHRSPLSGTQESGECKCNILAQTLRSNPRTGRC
jgi:hypothetical protein